MFGKHKPKWNTKAKVKTIKNDEIKDLKAKTKSDYYVRVQSLKPKNKWIEIQNSEKKISAVVPLHIKQPRKTDSESKTEISLSPKLKKVLQFNKGRCSDILRWRLSPKPNHNDAIILKNKTQKFVVSNKH